MEISTVLREEMNKDVARCEEYSEISGSESLYGVLVAKYSVLDSNFCKDLSTNGKAAFPGKGFDYRQELKAVAAKLRMWLLSAQSEKESTTLTPKEKVDAFIKRGEDIKFTEFHPAQGGFPFSYISGPKFDTWMSEINIFNERYLKKHPLHDSIYSTFFHRSTKSSTCDDMLGYLRALAADNDYFEAILTSVSNNVTYGVRNISDMLSDDISRCQQYLSEDTSKDAWRNLYTEITGRYDSVISGFGQGLYSYFAEQHFYDSEVDIGTIKHNVKLLLQKMITYQAVHYVPKPLSKKEATIITSNKIFIVHGHDEAAKQTMARTLEHAGFEAIILHEQASCGNTVIEKIEENSDVAYAVVLYTLCDMGRAKEKKCENERYRARQNVVFEHGYLIGKLGRKRVVALVKGDIETPGDITGIVYILMDDAGAWKMQLAKEMESAGMPVDMNQFCK